MRKIAGFLIAFGAFSQQPPSITRAEAIEMVGVIGKYRELVLRDTTAVDFCAIDAFWDERGAFTAEPQARSLNRYSRRADCPRTPATLNTNVIVTGIVREARRDVISSTTLRGNTRIFEQYVLFRGPSGDLRGDSYTVIAIAQS